MVENGHRPDILDLSNIGGRRPKVKLHDGETYEVVSPSDLGPVFGAQFKEFYEEYTALEDKEDLESAQRQEGLARKMARLICPEMPDDVANSLPFQAAVGLMLDFLGTVKESEGMDPQLKAVMDRMQGLTDN